MIRCKDNYTQKGSKVDEKYLIFQPNPIEKGQCLQSTVAQEEKKNHTQHVSWNEIKTQVRFFLRNVENQPPTRWAIKSATDQKMS